MCGECRPPRAVELAAKRRGPVPAHRGCLSAGLSRPTWARVWRPTDRRRDGSRDAPRGRPVPLWEELSVTRREGRPGAALRESLPRFPARVCWQRAAVEPAPFAVEPMVLALPERTLLALRVRRESAEREVRLRTLRAAVRGHSSPRWVAVVELQPVARRPAEEAFLPRAVWEWSRQPLRVAWSPVWVVLRKPFALPGLVR